MKERVELSIVSPVYMGEHFVDNLVKRLADVCSNLCESFEIILVEDFSKDNSWKKIEENCGKHPFVKGLKLSRNFGQQYAIQAGLEASIGKYVITMDCDLQDPPEEIPKFMAKARDGFDIVLGSRRNRQDDFLKKLLSKMFYKVLSYLTETQQDHTVANFILYRRNVVEALSSMKDFYRYYPMLLQLVGFERITIDIQHADRESGKSSYSIKKRIKLSIETIISFSDKPLRLSVKAGVVLTLLSTLFAIVLVILYFKGQYSAPGWASLALLLSFYAGIIISVLGMVGIYVGRTFETVKGRPSYIVQQRLNF